MSVIRKVICDCCGAEIMQDPCRVKIIKQNPETADIDKDYVYEDEGQDFCDDCASRIIDFVKGLTTKQRSGAELPPQQSQQ
ncbi:MAG: hypothetical protein PHQ72_12190 [Hespellia sp.]|nr:hypothetical protein [Hespellia sp.]